MTITTLKDLKDLLDSTNGTIFSVKFIKKDGSIREMQCRTGVTKHLRGGESTIAHIEDLYGVFDVAKKAYRCFYLNTVLEVTVAGRKIKMQ